MTIRAMFARAILVAALLALSTTAPAKNFRWAAQSDTSTLDPHAQNELYTNVLNNLVYEYLVSYDKNVELIPVLATSWENTSPTTWKFNLRRGVKFQDGSPFTADDVVFTFARAKQSGTTFKLY